ncbi:MAG TPA: VCBS repeat-containing protein, partial [Planctomycetota bacterium]|nr:VCBS repeat-containing protein [Planctomycetota bacterium]
MRAMVLVMAGVLTAAGPEKGDAPFAFRDVAEETGLMPQVGGIRGHAAGWGDADGNGWIDLYVGTFHNEGSKANMFFRNEGGRFRLDGQKSVGISTRANSGLFADFDNDGDLDLYVASMPGVVKGDIMAPCTLFRNDGGGTYVNVAEGNGACPAEGFAGRSAAALDFDGDGLLDLLVGDCVFKMYKGRRTSRLFRNKGGLQFEDVSTDVGLPSGIPGLGVAAGDVNNDGWPDVFIASREGGNRLFLNDGKGKFREAACSPTLFDWNPPAKSDDSPAGAVFGDVNRDGLLDLVIGQHYSTPWKSPVAVRLYLNRGIESGEPRFEDVTEAVGLDPLFIKAPHVEIQDFDNDGWPDISTSIVKFAGKTPHPVIFRGLGVRDGLPRFRDSSAGVNDFPTADDRSKSVRASHSAWRSVART